MSAALRLADLEGGIDCAPVSRTQTEVEIGILKIRMKSAVQEFLRNVNASL